MYPGSVPRLDVVRVREAMDKYQFSSTEVNSVYIDPTKDVYRVSDLAVLCFNTTVLMEDWKSIQTKTAEVLGSRRGKSTDFTCAFLFTATSHKQMVTQSYQFEAIVQRHYKAKVIISHWGELGNRNMINVVIAISPLAISTT